MHKKSLMLTALFSVLALIAGMGATASAGVVGPVGLVTPDSPVAWESGDPEFTGPSGKPSVVGLNYHGIWQDLNDTTRAGLLDQIAGAGVEWVRLDIAWGMLQPNGPGSYDMGYGVPRVDKRVEEIHARGMKTLMLLHWAPQWSTGTSKKNGVPRDPEEYADAAAWVADRYAGKVQAMEIWNEPDLADFLANQDVATHVGLVKAAYRRLRLRTRI